eukprot:jgi/Orpsp1_1/1183455/evm.model.c7180000085278.1
MSSTNIEIDFISSLRNNSYSQFINENISFFQNTLGSDVDSYVMKKFIGQLVNLINDKSFSKYSAVEKALNNPALKYVLEAFRNSDVLVKAFDMENKNAIKWLLNMDINPLVQDEDGRTAIMVAAEKGNRSYVKKNIENLELINMTDKKGENLLFYALREFKENNTSSVVTMNYELLLIDSGIHINHHNKLGETALNYMCKNKIYKTIFQNFLLNTKIDPNIPDENGYTPIMYLVEYGRYLELNHIETDKASFENYIRVMKTLITYEADFNVPIDKDNNTPLMVMLLVGDIGTATYCVEKLKKLDLSVKNKYGESVTSLCYKLKYYKLLPLLINNPTFDYHYRDVCYNNNLLILSSVGSPSSMKPLLENDANIINEENVRGENALIVASKINNIAVMDALFKYGIEVNHQDKKGNTALHYAVEIKQPAIVQKLVSKNADINIKNNEGKSPLDLANDLGNKDLISILTSNKAAKNNKKFKKSKKAVKSTTIY